MVYHTRPREKFIVIRDYILKKKVGCCFETGPHGSQAQNIIKTRAFYAAKDDFELLVFLLLPPKYGDDRYVLQSLVYMVLGMGPRASCMFSKHYTN